MDDSILRQAIRRYVLGPWGRQLEEYDIAMDKAAFKEPLIVPTPPNASAILSKLRTLVLSTDEQIHYRMEEDNKEKGS